ncbi:uncharacterized protein LOC110716900 [Chenopodium quinoa]|uniref:uncharacterized protein LOC110716900 n=1 Tax=Chenopodium quinoa TaxID=63459 RepID=UPI000B772D66|nr:uncharacterized protein LOC110716900 [Chenopodium quinoa]
MEVGYKQNSSIIHGEGALLSNRKRVLEGDIDEEERMVEGVGEKRRRFTMTDETGNSDIQVEGVGNPQPSKDNENLKLERFRDWQPEDEGVCRSSTGRAGGISLWWKGVDVAIVSFSINHFVVDIKDNQGITRWRAIRIYGWPEGENKHKTWNLMRNMRSSCEVPCLMFGDFNEIICMSEKKGGAVRRENGMNEFKDTIDDCFLRDLGYSGSPFTWQWGKSITTAVRERLDRLLGDTGWCELFPKAGVRHLARITSDHSPIILDTMPQRNEKKKKHMFRFEAMWLANDECKLVVRDAWTMGVNRPIHERVSVCAASLKAWAFKTYGDRKKRLENKEEELRAAQSLPMDAHMLETCENLAAEVDELQRQEETYWFTRERANEMHDGDRNTSYFHRKASKRQTNNRISGLYDSKGVWQEEEDRIKQIFENYFGSLFSSESPEDLDAATDGLEHRITEEMNSALDATPTEDEIKRALFQMHPNKAPELLNKSAREKKLHGTRVCRSAPRTSHLFFADDSLLFARATTQECSIIADIIRVYERASGQKVNLDKTDVAFSRGVPVDRRGEIVSTLGVREVEKHNKYLGLPTIIRRSKKEIFARLKERLWKSLNVWNNKLLSKPGKEVLIKEVAQAIPTYMMSIFKIPDGVIDEFHTMLCKFWWGSKGNRRKIHWNN